MKVPKPVVLLLLQSVSGTCAGRALHVVSAAGQHAVVRRADVHMLRAWWLKRGGQHAIPAACDMQEQTQAAAGSARSTWSMPMLGARSAPNPPRLACGSRGKGSMLWSAARSPDMPRAWWLTPTCLGHGG